MRVVFDTNVFISALAIPGGRAEEALLRILDGRDELYVAKAIIHEVVSVLGRKFARDTEELARMAVFLAEIGHVVNPIRTTTLLDDEGDNRILECAVTAEVESIVTGDREMLSLGSFEGARILSLREYLEGE